MSAAARLRRLDNDADIIVLEKSGYVSYANCGLPYFVGGVIEDESSLLLQTPATLFERFRIDVRTNHEALRILRESKVVLVKDLVTGEVEEIAYDVVVLSPGASPIIPPIDGVENAFVLRSVEDVQKIVSNLTSMPTTSVVIGGGFIGVELAENLTNRGIKVSIVEAASQVLAPLDPEMAEVVANELRTHGVGLHLSDAVARINEDHVELNSGQVLDAGIVIVAIGVRPDVGLARDAGLCVGERGGIVVDEFNRTSDPSIYAIGDVAEKRDSLDAGATLVPLANIANRQGRVVADHIAGRSVRVTPSIGTAIVRVFDLTVASTGWNEKRLQAARHPFLAIHTHPFSHATYFPGALPMSLKMLVDPETGEILGAQGIGSDGVDKRIDVLATAIRAGLPAVELADLELAYAPPFGSAKDPVNMLGYIAENRLSGLVETVRWHEVGNLKCQTVVDVRSREEFDEGALPGAHNIPLDELRARFDEVPSRDVLVYCQVGQRGHVAALLLSHLGLRVKNLDGGYETWRHSPAAREGVGSVPSVIERKLHV
jgi:NADPH-dependent 2,4-dienoyl-CoA reductase/sulfur reductase-like enzyme/rhodanese-related sulfurtransferase